MFLFIFIYIFFKLYLIKNSFSQKVDFEKLKFLFTLIPSLMFLEMLILFIFSFYLIKLMNYKIRRDSADRSFKIVIDKTFVFAIMIFIFVFQIFRTFFCSFALKMMLLFRKVWVKTDFEKKDNQDLNQSTIKKEAEKYIDVEKGNISKGNYNLQLFLVYNY